MSGSNFSSLYNDSEIKIQDMLHNFSENVIIINELATNIEIRQGELQHKNEEMVRLERKRENAKTIVNATKVRHLSLLEKLRHLQSVIQNEKNFKSIHFLEFSSAESKLSEVLKVERELKRDHIKALEATTMKSFEDRRKFRDTIVSWN